MRTQRCDIVPLVGDAYFLGLAEAAQAQEQRTHLLGLLEDSDYGPTARVEGDFKGLGFGTYCGEQIAQRNLTWRRALDVRMFTRKLIKCWVGRKPQREGKLRAGFGCSAKLANRAWCVRFEMRGEACSELLQAGQRNRD